VNEKVFWPGDFGGGGFGGCVDFGGVGGRGAGGGREWRITREDVARYLGRFSVS